MIKLRIKLSTTYVINSGKNGKKSISLSRTREYGRLKLSQRKPKTKLSYSLSRTREYGSENLALPP